MSAKKPTDGETGDEETDAILAEMQEDGEDLPFKGEADSKDDDSDKDEKDEDEDDEESEDDDDEDEDSDEDDEESDDDEDEDSDKEDEDSKKSKTKKDDEDESDEESEDEEDDESEGDDEEEEEEDDDDEQSAHKPAWMRLRDTKKKLRDAEKLIADLSKSKDDLDMEKRFAEYGSKHKLQPEAVKELAQLAASLSAKQVGLDDKTKKDIADVLKQSKESKYWEKQSKEYVKDFRSNVLPLAKRDGANVARVQKVLQSLAFAPENAKKSLVSIYLDKFGKNGSKKKITSEGGRSFRGTPGKELGEVSAEDLDNMTDEEFDKFSDSLAKDQKSKITRR